MKQSLLIVSLLAVALAACSKKSDAQTEPSKPKVEHPVNAAGKQKINVLAVQYSYDNAFLNNTIRILCVDGVKLVSNDEHIIELHDTKTGLPQSCTNTPIKPASGEPQ